MPSDETLPQPLQDYFEAKNRHDVEAMLAAFADTAIVRDESRTHLGRPAIRAWMEETTRTYRDTAAIAEVVSEGPRTRVGAIVSGDFPGSPVRLRFAFTLVEERIATLEVGA